MGANGSSADTPSAKYQGFLRLSGRLFDLSPTLSPIDAPAGGERGRSPQHRPPRRLRSCSSLAWQTDPSRSPVSLIAIAPRQPWDNPDRDKTGGIPTFPRRKFPGDIRSKWYRIRVAPVVFRRVPSSAVASTLQGGGVSPPHGNGSASPRVP